jgi:hypothetical protein
MARTQLNLGTQGADGTLGRADLNTTTAGNAVITKIINGNTNTASITSTGVDSGTGDVTITITGYYPFQFFVGGSPLASEVLMYLPALLPYTLSSSGISATAITAATSSTVFTIKKNGSSIGTITFATAGTTGTVSFSSSVTFAAGDIFELDAPSTADSTLASIVFSFLGTR